jgi:hypothetical protein
MATEARELDYRPSYIAAAIVSLAVLILYLITLAPNTAMWDTSEYIAAAYTLGLPHPPGNPLFVLIGRVFSILPIAGSVAARINILAALCSAVSAGMWFLITERVLVGWFPERWQRIVGGALCALIGATAFTVWNQSVVNEKVYTVSLVGLAVISWLMIRWSDEPDGRYADRTLVLVAYLLGLGYANHMAGMLAGPAAALAVVIRRPRTLVRWKLILACVGAMALGITPFATQPIRSAYYPAINEGEPTGCRNGIGWSCTFSKDTYDSFMYNFNRGQYGKPSITDRQAPFITGQLAMWWFYFKWQWLRDAHNNQPGLQNVLGALFLVLGLMGGWVHYHRDRRSFWYFGTLMFTSTLLLIYYLNFKYGSSQPAPPEVNQLQREVRDRDYFFLWSFSAWGVWAALGLVFIWESLASFFGTVRIKLGADSVEMPTQKGWRFTSPILALALIPLFANWTSAPRKGQTDTRDFAADLLNSVEPYGVLITVGDNDTFPLWYAQEVEHIRQDVVLVNTSLANTDWYARQIVRRPLYTYDEAKGPAVYRGKQWVKPAKPALSMTVAQADSIAAIVPISQAAEFTKDGLRAVIDPKNTPLEGYLQRADLIVLYMIRDSWPERPIYFSRTSGNYAAQLGLVNKTIAQGLAAKLFIPPATPSRDTVFIAEQGEWMDVPRTKALWTQVFEAPKALIKRGDWIDQPSIGIPYLYIATGATLAQILNDQGDGAGARSVYAQTRQVAQAVRVESRGSVIPESLPAARPTEPITGDTRAPGRQLPVKTIPPPATKTKTAPTKKKP